MPYRRAHLAAWFLIGLTVVAFWPGHLSRLDGDIRHVLRVDGSTSQSPDGSSRCPGNVVNQLTGTPDIVSNSYQ